MVLNIIISITFADNFCLYPQLTLQINQQHSRLSVSGITQSDKIIPPFKEYELFIFGFDICGVVHIINQ